MRPGALVLAGLAAVSVIASCGKSGRCTATSCEPGSVCDAQQGICVEAPRDAGRGGGLAAGGGVGGGSAAGGQAGGAQGGGAAGAGVDGGGSVCGACNLAAPICDTKARRCVRCTLVEGCFGETPICDISFQGGLGKCERCVADGGGCGGATPICDQPMNRCVGCLRHTDCVSGNCDLLNNVCFPPSGGGGAGGGAGGGGAGGGSSTGGGIAYPDGGSMCPGPRDGGITPCTTECPPGFFCAGNECRLNGAGADLQVTLRWDSTEDLDLHLDEPAADGGVCEIWYAQRTPACAQGSLDLDSQAACSMDLVLIENIIYPADGGRPNPGTYAVRVDHYTSCSPIQWVPFEVEVRKGTTRMGLCGVFQPSDPDWATHGSAGAGRPIFTFTYP